MGGLEITVAGEPNAGRETTHIVVRVDGCRLVGIDWPNALDPAGLAELLRAHVMLCAAARADGTASRATPRHLALVAEPAA